MKTPSGTSLWLTGMMAEYIRVSFCWSRMSVWRMWHVIPSSWCHIPRLYPIGTNREIFVNPSDTLHRRASLSGVSSIREPDNSGGDSVSWGLTGRRQ